MNENTTNTQEVENTSINIDKIKMFGVEGGINTPNARRIKSIDEMDCTNTLEKSDNINEIKNVTEYGTSDDILLNENLQKNITNENVIYSDIDTLITASNSESKHIENVKLLEEKSISDENKKIHIFVDAITLNIQVELSQDEINCGITPRHRGFSIDVDNSIYLLLNLILSDENDFRIKFTKNAKLFCNYSQVLPNENSNNTGNSRGKVEILIHQDESAEQELIPSKVRVFELLLGDEEVNYYLNNFYEYVKGQKELLYKEVNYYEDFIYEKLLESKDILQNSHKMNTEKIMKVLEKFNEEIIGEKIDEKAKKVDVKNDKEMKSRWRKRFDKGIFHLSKGKDGNYISSINYKEQGLEIELLADILKMEIAQLRRLIKRLEKKTNKKYIFPNKKGTKIIDNTKGKITKEEIEDVYSKSIGFITFEGFFEVMSYANSL